VSEALDNARRLARNADNARPDWATPVALVSIAWGLVAIAERMEQKPASARCKEAYMVPKPGLKAWRGQPMSFRERVRLAWRVLREGR
jgi:hypothetical protein